MARSPERSGLFLCLMRQSGGPNAHPFLALLYVTFLKNRYLWLRDSGTRALPIAA
jgi:hypothetical protein